MLPPTATLVKVITLSYHHKTAWLVSWQCNPVKENENRKYVRRLFTSPCKDLKLSNGIPMSTDCIHFYFTAPQNVPKISVDLNGPPKRSKVCEKLMTAVIGNGFCASNSHLSYHSASYLVI